MSMSRASPTSLQPSVELSTPSHTCHWACHELQPLDLAHTNTAEHVTYSTNLAHTLSVRVRAYSHTHTSAEQCHVLQPRSPPQCTRTAVFSHSTPQLGNVTYSTPRSHPQCTRTGRILTPTPQLGNVTYSTPSQARTSNLAHTLSVRVRPYYHNQHLSWAMSRTPHQARLEPPAPPQVTPPCLMCRPPHRPRPPQ